MAPDPVARNGNDVALRTSAYYRQLAESALRDAGVIEPPVMVEAVAARLGIPVRLFRMPVFFDGAVINEDGMPVILINARRDEMGRRKVLAHLLGHVLLVLEDPDYAYPRNTTPEHGEADSIADELVAPSWMIEEQSNKWFKDHRYLARLFGLTEQEMLTRMRDLGIIKGSGITWDY